MGNYLKMPDKRRVLALLELSWSYRRIERETGVRREPVARDDPRRQSKAANLSAGSSHVHGLPGVAEPYRAQIEAGLRQGLTVQRIYQGAMPRYRYGKNRNSGVRWAASDAQAGKSVSTTVTHSAWMTR